MAKEKSPQQILWWDRTAVDFGFRARHETYYGRMVALLPGAGEPLISESFSSCS